MSRPKRLRAQGNSGFAVADAGGECPICSKAFRDLTELEIHASTCGTIGESTAKSRQSTTTTGHQKKHNVPSQRSNKQSSTTLKSEEANQLREKARRIFKVYLEKKNVKAVSFHSAKSRILNDSGCCSWSFVDAAIVCQISIGRNCWPG